MKVAVYYNNNDIRIEELPKPGIEEGEILVKVEASGICGTDVMEWYRIRKAPRVLGHEMAGEIVEVGRSVMGFKDGDRVFISHHVPCYRCHYCTQGNYTACESLHSGNYDPGGFSEYIRVPEENVRHGTFLLPKGVAGYMTWGPTPLAEDAYDIYWMAVSPAEQGRGRGKEVVRWLEAEVRRRDGRVVIIKTSSQPKYSGTRQFYIDLGYKELARGPDFYPCRGRPRHLREVFSLGVWRWTTGKS